MKSPSETARVTRRHVLQWSAACCLPLIGPSGNAQTSSRSAFDSAVTDYLESLRQADGGYQWARGERSHLTPTFAATGCYQVLGVSPPHKQKLADYIRTHHPFQIKQMRRDLKTFEYQQIQALAWLDEPAESVEAQVESWTRPAEYPQHYETHGYPVFEYEMMPIICRGLLGMPVDPVAPAFLDYLKPRRRSSGSFNNTPASDGSDGHVVNTYWGLLALQHLAGSHPWQAGRWREKTVGWIHRCRTADGGYRWQPDPPVAGNEDVYYTWAALKCLELLNAAPEDPESTIQCVLRLQNADHGFGSREGWLSNPVSTYYALDALRILDALRDPVPTARNRTSPKPEAIPDDAKVFTIQIEAHGQGSPSDAVDMAKELKIHLWAAKNALPGWIDEAQRIADRQRVPVTLVQAAEEYGTFVSLAGQGTYSHTSDLIAPAGADIGASLAGRDSVDWETFRSERLKPLLDADGRLVWQFNENELLTRLYLDDSLQRGGYSAISTFHFGNPDFINSEPFLLHYLGQIPMVALQDAHGSEPWWFADQLTGFRTLFLAREPTWQGWLEALERNHVAAVRHDSVSGHQTWMHTGSDRVREFLLRRRPQWQWWDDGKITRPPATIAAVYPDSPFEVATPDSGVNLRVRCRWSNTAHGQPKEPRMRLDELVVDGSAVQTRAHEVRRRGRLEDVFHTHHLRKENEKTRTVVLRLTDLASGKPLERQVEIRC